MTIQLIFIIISSLLIVLIYSARLLSKKQGTLLFPEKFLNKADDIIFGFIAFVYKVYSTISKKVISFLKNVPHGVVHFVHVVSKSIAHHTHALTEKFKHTGKK